MIAGDGAGDGERTARAVAAGCGMTRLADVTGLDRIGLPVWQAIRPASRSVSVHQGKGLTAAQARLGACMEAIECAHAEAWAGEVRWVPHDALPPGERSVAADDFAGVRGTAGPLAWTAIERLGGGRLWVPAAAVSLDMTGPLPAGVERSTSGQGAGFAEDFASLKGLCELVERDAFYRWLGRPLLERGGDGLDVGAIAFPWFADLTGRLAALGIGLRVFAVPAVIGLPVVAAQLVDGGAAAYNHPLASGLCAHPDPERALRGAVAEAAQSRLTKIAGARDDLPLDEAEAVARRPGLGLALPRGTVRPTFDQRFAGRVTASPAADLARCVGALADAGYPVVGRVRLSPPGGAVTVVKLFVPGLGSARRTRRPAAA